MRRLFLTVSIICIFALLAGCSSKGAGSKDGSANGLNGALSEQDLNAQREGRFGEGSIPLAEGEGVFRDINFGYDSADIDDVARQNIEYNVQILQANPEVKVQIEGHCDARGTAEYNMALGAKRARAVKDVLISYGISGNRLDTISYGEEVPLDPGQNERAWSANRRAHFSAYRALPNS